MKTLIPSSKFLVWPPYAKVQLPLSDPDELNLYIIPPAVIQWLFSAYAAFSFNEQVVSDIVHPGNSPINYLINNKYLKVLIIINNIINKKLLIIY